MKIISGFTLGDPLVTLPLGYCPGVLHYKLVCVFGMSGFIFRVSVGLVAAG